MRRDLVESAVLVGHTNNVYDACVAIEWVHHLREDLEHHMGREIDDEGEWEDALFILTAMQACVLFTVLVDDKCESCGRGEQEIFTWRKPS